MANKKRLIDANALMDAFRKYMAKRFDRERCVSEENCKVCDRECLWRRIVKDAPTVDAVSKGVHDQVRWERDIAMEQLKEHGIPFCGIAPDVVKVVRCKDCKSWEQYNACDGTKPHRCMNHDAIFYKRTAPNDFCSYGEKRGDGNG